MIRRTDPFCGVMRDGSDKKKLTHISWGLRDNSGGFAIFTASAAPNRNDLHALLVQAAFSDLGFIPTVLKIYLPSF
jgi:hypothetical protein